MPIDKEAAVTWGTVAAAIGAAIVLLQSFGVNISDDQESAILKFSTIALPLVTGLVIRGFVWSKDSVEAKAHEAFEDGQQGAAAPPKVA